MNRQSRRAQAKQDKRQDREKARRKTARRARIQSLRQGRRQVVQRGKTQDRPRGGRLPGRFSGALAAATVFFIVLQALVPPQEQTSLNSVVSAAFYLLLGYFLCLWLLRRGVGRAMWVAVFSGVMLAIGIELGKLVRTEYSADIIMLALILPGLLLG